MTFFSKIRRRLAVALLPGVIRRGYPFRRAVSQGGLAAAPTTANQEAIGNVELGRQCAQELERTVGYAAKFLRDMENAIVGRRGFLFRPRCSFGPERPDAVANQWLLEQWHGWGAERKFVSVDGRLNFVQLCKLAVRAVPRDGEFLCRMRRAPAGNPYLFSLEPLDPARLPASYNQARTANGNKVVMGVEMDAESNRPVAYHLNLSSETAWSGVPGAALALTRVPAEEIVHLFLVQRPESWRGMTWFAPTVQRFANLNGYEEAEVVAARVSAARMGFLEPQIDADEFDRDKFDENPPVETYEPGTIKPLPYGWKYNEPTLTHPSSGYAPYVKGVLRSVAGALGVSYNNLNNDLEGVNYSSIKAGTINERDFYENLQEWFASAFLREVYRAWLKMQLLREDCPFPSSRFTHLCRVEFKPRKFLWIDPLKDAMFYEMARKNLWISDTDICDALGADIDDVYEQIAREQKKRAALGIQNPQAEAIATAAIKATALAAAKQELLVDGEEDV